MLVKAHSFYNDTSSLSKSIKINADNLTLFGFFDKLEKAGFKVQMNLYLITSEWT